MTANRATDTDSLSQTALPWLFAEVPAVFTAAYNPEIPWDLLGGPLTSVLDALPSEAIEVRLSPEVHLAGDRIAIGRGTRIHPGVVIEGPVWIGRKVEIRPGAYIRGGAWIGDGAMVGANTEIKNSILFPGAHAPHLNYVGDSILGSGVNLGAGTILSNFRHDGREVLIPKVPQPLASGRRKLGAILGDHVLIGSNCVLHPGVIVGRGAQIYPGVQLRPGIYPEASIIKLRQETEIVRLSPGEEQPHEPEKAPKLLSIPYSDELLLSLKESATEFNTEARLLLAVKLYEMGRISTGRAAELAGMPRVAFFFALSRFGLSPIGVDPSELEGDLANA